MASKTTMNLAIRERNVSHSPAVILPVVLAILAAAVLVSWAVGSRLAQVSAAQSKTNEMRATLAAIQAGYADYDEVQEQYNRYTYKDYDRTLADRLDVLSLMERQIYPVGSVRSFSVAGRQMALVVEGLTLESTSALITRLNAEPLVSSVNVSTYDATSDSGTVYPVTNMVIVLADATQAGEVDK